MLHSFLLIYHPYSPSFREMILYLYIYITSTDFMISSLFNHTICQLSHYCTIWSSPSTGLCCHLNGVGSGWHETRDDITSGGSWGRKCLTPILHWVACYVSIAVDTVHWPPLDSDAGGGHFRYTHRSGRGRWSWRYSHTIQ